MQSKVTNNSNNTNIIGRIKKNIRKQQRIYTTTAATETESLHAKQQQPFNNSDTAAMVVVGPKHIFPQRHVFDRILSGIFSPGGLHK